MSRNLLVVGTGRCGLVSAMHLLNRQPDTNITLESPPLLPWRRFPGDNQMSERLVRFRKKRHHAVIGDAAAFYLPYIDRAIAADPHVRIVALRRPREDVVASFARFLDEYTSYPVDHWAEEPAVGWSRDALWTQTFPKYDTADRANGIRKYWDEYDRRLNELIARYPEQVRGFDMNESLNTESGVRSLLTFAGYPVEQQVVDVGIRVTREKPVPKWTHAKRTSNHPLDPGKCVILVPYGGFIHPPCEAALRELERRGFPVRRVGGYAAIDQGRNQMATDSLLEGFEETMWIDSDVDFHPDAIDQLRAHGLPICSGIYSQKGRRAIASHILPGTPRLAFGQAGGLLEILYAATGFLHVRRDVYLKVQHQLHLPVTNERFGSAMIPFFQPMLHPIEDGHWYLAEDFAFSQRVRSVGYKIVADTSIRLWHIGGYSYGWEDAGLERERTNSFALHFPEKLPDTDGR